MIDLGCPVSYGTYAIRKRLDKVLDHTDFTRKRILDIGCGNGAYTFDISKTARFTAGIDIEPQRLALFQKQINNRGQPNIIALQMSGEDLGFKDKSFDTAILIETLEHIPDNRKCLKEVHRILKPGGQLILFVPNKWYPFETHGVRIGRWQINYKNLPFLSWLPSSIHSRIANARIYSPRRVRRLLSDIGFDIKTIGWIYPPLDNVPLPLAAKRIYREKICPFLESSWLKIFGVSIFVLAERPI